MAKDIRPALRDLLLGDAAIAALVSARVYPGRLPQGVTATSIVYGKVSARPDHHMGGPSGLARPRLQIDAWAMTAEAAQTLADLIKARLDGFSGFIGGDDNRIEVQGIFFADEREDYDDTARLHRASRDYFVNYGES